MSDQGLIGAVLVATLADTPPPAAARDRAV